MTVQVSADQENNITLSCTAFWVVAPSERKVTTNKQTWFEQQLASSCYTKAVNPSETRSEK